MKPPRWRISLGTLLLCLTIIALAFSHVVTSRQLSATRKELQDYQYQYGHLVVDDPSRPHMLGYAKQENPWKWHVSFPAGRKYKMMCGIGEIPTSGVPRVSKLQHVHETSVHGAGEKSMMFVSLTESASELLNFSMGCDGSQTVNQIIPTAEVYSQSDFNIYLVGQGKTYTPAADEPFVIFYRTERKPTQADGAAHGVVVWVEPVN